MLGHLGKYRLDARLGGGGMAEVFVASTIGAEGFSRRVAIKRVLPGYSENTQFAQMFVAEAQISSRMQHPNIVSVLDFDRDAEGRLFLVMELVEGKDLDALIATGLLPFPVVIFVLTEMLRGLGYAHDLPAVPGAPGQEMRGIVHRDVSPHNVLLSWEGAVKVSDFGIAKARAASEATASVFIKGKPAYMSPEQANGEPLDGRSDLFAVGVMLWEMLVGRRLFVGGDTRSLLAQVLFSPIPRPRQQRADVPRDLDRICMKLLERELPARYGSGEEVIADLLACEDAPRGGHQELVSLLAERFGPEFPRRHSGRIASRRAVSGAEPGTATPTPVPFRPVPPSGGGVPSSTMLGHGGNAADSQTPGPSWSGGFGPPSPAGGSAMMSGGPGGTGGGYPASGGALGSAAGMGGPGPGVDQLMAAHTRTLPPGTAPVTVVRSGWSTGAVIGAAVGGMSLVGIVLIAVLTGGKEQPAALGDAATGDAGLIGEARDAGPRDARAAATTPDGAPGGAADSAGSAGSAGSAAAAPDAAPGGSDAGGAGAPDAAAGKPAQAPEEDDGSGSGSAASRPGGGEPGGRPSRRKAKISFVCDPPQAVHVDGRRIGETFIARSLEEGPHRIKFVNTELGSSKTLEIKVEGGVEKTVECPR